MTGTAVYPTKQAEIVPAALALNVRHNGVVHCRVVLLKVVTERVARVAEHGRVTARKMLSGYASLSCSSATPRSRTSCRP